MQDKYKTDHLDSEVLVYKLEIIINHRKILDILVEKCKNFN